MRWVNHYHPSSLLSPSRDGHPDGEPTVESAANYVLRIPSKRKKKALGSQTRNMGLKNLLVRVTRCLTRFTVLSA